MIKKMILAYHADCAVMADCKRCFRDFVASAKYIGSHKNEAFSISQVFDG